MTVVLIVGVGWVLVAAFVCCLGRAAKIGNRCELGSSRGGRGSAPVDGTTSGTGPRPERAGACTGRSRAA